MAARLGRQRNTLDLKKLVGFYDPHVASAQAQLTTRLDQAGLALDPATLDSLRRYLLNALFKVSYKTLIAHFKLLEATHSFEQFGASLCDPEVRDYFFSRYPVMQGWMDQLAANWAEQSALLLTRFEADKHAIARTLLGSGEAIAIRAVRLGMGDLHRGGRSVAQIELTNGDKLIYKPRSLAIDLHFGALVAWLNTLGGIGLRTPASLDRGHYGWVSFVSEAACADQAEVDDYYQRMGHWLALLYVLEGTDFHYENIIAAGPHPVLIDLESFFHPELSTNENSADMDNSVLKSGILPHRLEDGASHLPDLSGVADAEGAEGALDELVLEEQEGSLAFVRKKGHLRGGANVPHLDGKKVIMGAASVAALQQGFQAMYRLLAAHKDDVKRRLAMFRNDEVRVLFRNTVTYRHLLDESTHPSLMRDWQSVQRHFGLLGLAITENAKVEKFVRFEEADLLRRDFPLFTTRVDSRDLWYADGGVVPGFFRTSGLDGALAKIDLLSEQDMHDQNWMIEKSFQIVQAAPSAPALPATPRVAGVYADAAQVRARAREEALRVADYVATQIHVEGDYASWLIVRATSIDNRKMELLPAFYDLFSGMPGEILFLETVAQMTGETRYANLAAKALNTLTFKLGHAQHTVHTVGMFAGWGGMLYMLAFLGTLKSDRSYFERAERYMATLDFDALIGADKELGLIKGSAGFVLACSELYLASGSPRALALAQAAGEHLLRKREQGSPGFSWLAVSKVPLAGMAHGASGFATAFARLYEATGDARYADAALKALDYERVLFSPQHQNWRDCRDIATHSGAEHYTATWAHGAPGVGLARVALLRAGIRNDAILEELAIAVRTTLALQSSPSHAVISGSFGKLELLLASQEFLAPALRAEVFPAAARLLQEVDVLGWNLREKAYRPLGLMSGVTGIGYQCLRIAFCDQVPSLLSGATARAASAAPGWQAGLECAA